MKETEAESSMRAAYRAFVERLGALSRAQRDAYAEAMRRIDEKRAKAVRDGVGSQKKT